jgi:hypothetical protein
MEDPPTKKATPAFHPISARCPETGKEKTVKLMATDADHILKYGPKVRYYDMVGDRTDPTTGSPVQQVLLHPKAIFKGVREHQGGGHCYCGIPTCAYTNSGAKIPPVPNKVYCVYLNAGDKLFEWGWETPDPDEPELPLGWKDRYQERIWPKP